MAWIIEQRLKTAIRSVFQSFGLDIRRTGASLAGLRCQILSSGVVTVVIDAGANIGQYARYIRRCGYVGRIISFEPLPDAYRLLASTARGDARWEHHNVALGNNDGSIVINVSENSVSSSPLPMLRRHVDAAPRSAYVGTATTTMRRLDHLRSQLVGPTDRVWLKLDVQGFESQVLEGADETLGQVEGIEAELSLAPLYEDQQLFYDISRYLYERDFTCLTLETDFADPHSGHVLQVDGLFLRNTRSS